MRRIMAHRHGAALPWVPAVALLSLPCQAATATRPDALIQSWYEANDACQRPSSQAKADACRMRERIGGDLAKDGWCRRNGADIEARWQRCPP